jgi:hypothetical protein
MHGLWLELKLRGRCASPEQDFWHRNLTEQGYVVRVAYSWLEAQELILEYLTPSRQR